MGLGDFMKGNWKSLLICAAVPLLTGGIAALLTKNSMAAFSLLNKPALSPPGWLFPIVWTVLYILMGVASYLVLSAQAPHESREKALKVYLIQLLFNFFWPIFFFRFGLYTFSFIWLIALWFLILLTAVLFYRISRLATFLLLPYLLWVAFAGYLNLGITLLN